MPSNDNEAPKAKRRPGRPKGSKNGPDAGKNGSPRKVPRADSRTVDGTQDTDSRSSQPSGPGQGKSKGGSATSSGDEPCVHLGPDFAIYESFRSHNHIIEGATTPKGRDEVRYHLDGLRRATRDLDMPRRTERSQGTGATGCCGSVRA
ncbi:hypothetical protein BV22DRAFT_1052776 [Leucogyrophana mollusca]|uniref:Uncharacterized protein n=1 Tax=Leucogyrophana mollusca TaxID=85980 RepID=A0ACB8AVI5_9AGAM|nr:hypothetical protein BV22DRAFT_1052776 [Leucogyrophana mollusca]